MTMASALARHESRPGGKAHERRHFPAINAYGQITARRCHLKTPSASLSVAFNPVICLDLRAVERCVRLEQRKAV
jgi:hypothetical protein